MSKSNSIKGYPFADILANLELSPKTKSNYPIFFKNIDHLLEILTASLIRTFKINHVSKTGLLVGKIRKGKDNFS